ncbi:MAG: zinc ribbon domain-containing protein [Candidatus Sericytochromatia bacterium]|nr:zinc ribbon domain-containing protein [Candidatus Sericytochromatia bacterium]
MGRDPWYDRIVPSSDKEVNAWRYAVPIYEYRCESCKNAFEVFLASAKEQAVCPTCQSHTLQRLMSTFAANVAGKGIAAPQAPHPTSRGGGCGGGCSCH